MQWKRKGSAPAQPYTRHGTGGAAEEGQLHSTHTETHYFRSVRAPRLDAMVHAALALADGVGRKHTRHTRPQISNTM